MTATNDRSPKTHGATWVAAQFALMEKEFAFQVINANQRVDRIQGELRRRIGALLEMPADQTSAYGTQPSRTASQKAPPT